MAKRVTERYNVSVAKEYDTNNGKRTQWVPIGNAVKFDDGSIIGNINALPVGAWWDGSFSIFKKEEADGQRNDERQPTAPKSGETDLTAARKRMAEMRNTAPDDLPF